MGRTPLCEGRNMGSHAAHPKFRTSGHLHLVGESPMLCATQALSDELERVTAPLPLSRSHAIVRVPSEQAAGPFGAGLRLEMHPECCSPCGSPSACGSGLRHFRSAPSFVRSPSKFAGPVSPVLRRPAERPQLRHSPELLRRKSPTELGFCWKFSTQNLTRAQNSEAFDHPAKA
jgi:hypothetical protein